MIKKTFSLLLLCAVVVLASCSKDDPTPDLTPGPVPTAFSSLAADGSAAKTTTVLTLTFDKAIAGLTVEDITLAVGETGTVKGALTAKGNGVYELAVSGISKGGEITVAVAKTGYTITPASKTVTVSYVTPVVAAAFSSLAADGSAAKTTTVLTLTFDKAIAGLTVEDITLTVGETGTVKGALTAKGNGVYELAVSGISKGGEITVAVAKTGYTITPASKTVTVNYYLTVAVGNFYYDDNTFSTTLEAGKTCIGIVFWIDPADATKGKIVSLAEATGKSWGAYGIVEKVNGITSTTDGATATKNLITARNGDTNFATVYSAFEWIYMTLNSRNIEGRWYIPAKEELIALYAGWNGGDTIRINETARTAFNAQLIAASGASISRSLYWSSMQHNDAYVWYVDFDHGYPNLDYKYRNFSVRAISAF